MGNNIVDIIYDIIFKVDPKKIAKTCSYSFSDSEGGKRARRPGRLPKLFFSPLFGEWEYVEKAKYLCYDFGVLI